MRKQQRRYAPAWARAGRSARHAFTVIELIVVLLVIGILTATATPKFLDSLLFHRVESAARRLKADLELARQTARLSSAAQTVTFTANGYSLGNTSASLNNPLAQHSVDLKAAPYELTSVAANFEGEASVGFDGYGTPSRSGTVVLTAKHRALTVTLDVDGRISID